MGLKRAQLSADENLAVGLVGGMVETVINMPILTYKFCKQEGRPYPKFPGMYRGVFVQAGSVAPLTATQMVLNGLIEKGITGSQRNMTDAESIICAMGAGAGSAILYGPVDLICIHQQKLGMNMIKTGKMLAERHGFLSIFRGVLPTAGREAFYTAGYLGLAPYFTNQLIQRPGWEESYYLSAVIGSVAAGVVANITSHPIDTVKTILQADITGEKFKKFGPTFRSVVSEHGIPGLYRGGLARSIRGSVAFFIVSSIREKFIINKTETGSAWSTLSTFTN
mmetsp:Transcript_14269/g.17640  ORF Transcript_14269/g.17640 Transcript_14269/m.17640 type:complete len:280 (-) Transcript_14269:149-988(-)|eukprot:CAMPEP_0204828448 /NCGR_PEP_ID=MMETSP1346-20131115/6209_1 /ASSEMBLY_ACC=CAM_ASM_000771 /TAXON_ID=215587 /ORGANISM="Aplanochytrium stocchinoi, Strain GSBS06" /LENGTH=279 /DNA_ID=CAMNT_0051957523 /DNA_START=70 /DNA_END=909 /DNA_ORIENTATION=+